MATAQAETITLNVADGTSMNAYVSTPEGNAKAPAMMVFQEIFGLNANIRAIADRFAEAGYVAIAPELFHRTAPGFVGLAFRAAVIHNDIRPLRGKAQSYAPTDAFTRARNQGYFPFKGPLRHSFLSSVKLSPLALGARPENGYDVTASLQ